MLRMVRDWSQRTTKETYEESMEAFWEVVVLQHASLFITHDSSNEGLSQGVSLGVSPQGAEQHQGARRSNPFVVWGAWFARQVRYYLM